MTKLSPLYTLYSIPPAQRGAGRQRAGESPAARTTA